MEAALTFLIFGAVGGALFLGLVYVVIYNGLIHKKNRVEQAFSGMDTQLKKRFDLIPNLVSTVQTYMQHERSTLEEITKLRGQAMAQAQGGGSLEGRVDLENAITGLLGRIMVQVENYPDLKASANFMHLQRSLNEVEEQISASRRAYNASVTDFNNAVEMFPSSLVAGTMGYQRKKVFEIAEAERANVNLGAQFKA